MREGRTLSDSGRSSHAEDMAKHSRGIVLEPQLIRNPNRENTSARQEVWRQGEGEEETATPRIEGLALPSDDDTLSPSQPLRRVHPTKSARPSVRGQVR